MKINMKKTINHGLWAHIKILVVFLGSLHFAHASLPQDDEDWPSIDPRSFLSFSLLAREVLTMGFTKGYEWLTDSEEISAYDQQERSNLVLLADLLRLLGNQTMSTNEAVTLRLAVGIIELMSNTGD